MSIGINLDSDFYPEKEESVIGRVFEVSRTVPRRTKHDVLASLMEEVGELATEVNISTGYSGKKEGEDGILGECVDVITCVVDLMWVSNPNITEEDLEKEVMKILELKLAKWKKKKLKGQQ